MYHTWPAHGQAHFCDCQDRDDRCFLPQIALDRPEFTVEFRTTVGGGIAPMYQNCDLGFIKRAIYLLKTGDRKTRLIGQCQCVANAAQHHCFEARREIWRDGCCGLETSIKYPCFYCLFNRFPVGSHPHAAAGEAMFQIGHNLAIRRLNEANEVFRL